MGCPKSDWVVKPNYFKVKPVDNFKDLFIENYDAEITDSEKSFIDKISSLNEFYVYQFPRFLAAECESDADYFEREDDNFVLRRNMFTIIEDA